jgi:uncharacterized protein YciI
MLFVATCLDKPHSLDKRMGSRPAHLAYLNGLGSRVKIGGALLAADHATPIGSMIIFEAESEDEALALLAKDPYSSAGLFESVSVRPWRPGVGQSLV